MEITAFLMMSIVPALLILAVNAALAVFSLGIAKRKGLKPVPAFLAVLLGSVVALLLIVALPEKAEAPR